MKDILSPILLWLMLVFTLALAACGGAPSAEPTPPTIHYGEDICDICGMIISEERHAAAYVTQDGVGHVFDDIGDLVRAYLVAQEEVTAFFVHDYQDKVWLRAETAHYVLSEELTTPMASGLAAFASSQEAQALATNLQGQVLTFEDLLAHYRQMAPMTMGEMGEQHSHDQ
jgi:nitrous oxide reductase accessory protein NosL